MLETKPEHRLGRRAELRLTHAQRLKADHQLVEQRMQFAQFLHGESYYQRGKCTSCKRRLSSREILEGFSNSPTDTTTMCPHCKTRFQPRLIAWGRDATSNIEVLYYCPVQTLYALRGQESKRPEDLAKTLPGVYQSALLHFGSLRVAFTKVGEQIGQAIEYALGDVDGWQTKVGPFLGLLPDTHIAAIVGVSHTTIRNRRKRAGFDRYRYSARDYI